MKMILLVILLLVAGPTFADTTINGPITFGTGFHTTGAKVNSDTLNLTVNPSGTLSVLDTFVNQVNISNDAAAAGGNNLWGWGVNWQCCTSAASGQRWALGGRIDIRGASNASDPLPSYVGVFGNGRAFVPAPNATAGVWGGNFNVSLDTGSTGWAEVQGVEIDVTMLAGSSSIRKAGLSIVQGPDDAVHGLVIDSAIALFNDAITTAPWNNIILLDNSTAPVISTTGAIVRVRGNASFSEVIAIEPGVTFVNGIDFNSAMVSGNILIGPGGTTTINKDGAAAFAAQLRVGAPVTQPMDTGAMALFYMGTNSVLEVRQNVNLSDGFAFSSSNAALDTAKGIEFFATNLRLSVSNLDINGSDGVTCSAGVSGSGTRIVKGIVTAC